MQTHTPFREIINPNSNFEFVGNMGKWIAVSVIAIVASIAMLFVNLAWRGDMLNWSIDFKGGTEIILHFNKKGTKEPAPVDASQVRQALAGSGMDDFAVSQFNWKIEDEKTGKSVEAQGFKLGTREFGAVAPGQQTKLKDDFTKAFSVNTVDKIDWSGDRIYVRSKKPMDYEAVKAFFAKEKLALRAWTPEDATSANAIQEGTGEYSSQFHIRGVETKIETALEAAIPDTDVVVEQTYGVGAAAGERLRNDGVRSLFYALIFILLYLIVRFDIRFAPGAVIALLHDSFLVIGAFAFTWQEFSLTTVAAVLTIIGYSVNDTVVIFDRIRENAEKLKDKKLPRVINISLNETLGRTLLTSTTLFATTLMMNILGTGLVRDFAFAMNVGVIVGVYSTLFIASPIALWIDKAYYQGSTGRVRAPSRPLEEP